MTKHKHGGAFSVIYLHNTPSVCYLQVSYRYLSLFLSIPTPVGFAWNLIPFSRNQTVLLVSGILMSVSLWPNVNFIVFLRTVFLEDGIYINRPKRIRP